MQKNYIINKFKALKMKRLLLQKKKKIKNCTEISFEIKRNNPVRQVVSVSIYTMVI